MTNFKFWFIISVVLFALSTSCGNKVQKTEVKSNMEYRELGKTGLMVSEIGLGCAAFTDKDTTFSRKFMDIAIDSGMNYIDIYDSDPVVRDNIGYGIKGRTEKMFIQGHIGSVWQNGQYKRTRDVEETKAGFEDLLTRLGRDYIEVGMVHIIDSHEDWIAIKDSPYLQYVLELKKQGKIKHIGFSSHNPAAALEAVESGLFEVMMFSINPLFDLLPADANLFAPPPEGLTFNNMDSVRSKLYEVCEEKGVGIAVMKVFGAGRLLDANQSLLGVALTPTQCIQYALDRPAVGTALSGSETIDELMQSLHYLVATDAEKDYTSTLKSAVNATWKGSCMYCNHCSPCPVGIDIAKVTKLLNIAITQGYVSESVRQQYNALEHKADECTQCGSCESRCPFSVSVRENMKKAQNVFKD